MPFHDQRIEPPLRIPKPLQPKRQTDSIHFPNNYVLINLYKVLFDFSYVMLLSPFRLKYNKSTNNFSVVTNRAQKVLYGITYLSLSIWLFGYIRRNRPKDTKSAAQVLVLLQVIASTLSKLVLLHSFWKYQNDFVEILNFVTSLSINIVESNSKFAITITKKYFVSTVCVTLVAIGTQEWITGIGIQEDNWKISDWSINWLFGRILAATRYAYFLDESIEATPEFSMTSLSIGNVTLLVVGSYGFFVRYLMSGFPVIYFICVTFTLWIAAKSFSNLLINKKKNLDWLTVNSHFVIIKKLSRLINATLGSNLIWLTLNEMFYFATSLDSILLEGGFLGLKHIKWHLIFGLLYYLTISVTFYYFAVDICSQVSIQITHQVFVTTFIFTKYIFDSGFYLDGRTEKLDV